MTLTVDQVREVLSYGGGLIVGAEDYSAEQLEEIAPYAGQAGVPLTIRGANKFTPEQLRTIGSHGGKQVIFDLTD